MTFTVEHTDPAIIKISGDVLGGADAMEFTQAVGDIIRAGVIRVVIDLGEVQLMNSSGLGMLVSAAKSLKSAQGVLSVVGANPKIRSLFKMTRLDSLFAQYQTRDEALAAHLS